MLISGVPYKIYTYSGGKFLERPKMAINTMQDLIDAMEKGWYKISLPTPIKFIKIDVDMSPTSTVDPEFPHTCPKCKGPAYVGFNSVQCKGNC
jgi:hypothetical protein